MHHVRTLGRLLGQPVGQPQYLDGYCVSNCEPVIPAEPTPAQQPSATGASPTATSHTEMQVRQNCMAGYFAWTTEKPWIAECLNEGERNAMLEGCYQAYGPQTITVQRLQEAMAMMEEACRQRLGPPTPSPLPTDAAAPPPMPPGDVAAFQQVIGDPQGMFANGAMQNGNGVAMNGDTGAPMGARPVEVSMWRRWGPILGALVVVGGAVYLLRS